MDPSLTVLWLVSDYLPPNIVPVSLRRVNHASRERFSASTRVDCTAWLPQWAVLEGAAEAARGSDERSRQQNVQRFWRTIVQAGDLSNIELLTTEGCPAWNMAAFVQAAAAGHVHVMSWLLALIDTGSYNAAHNQAITDSLLSETVGQGGPGGLDFHNSAGQPPMSDLCRRVFLVTLQQESTIAAAANGRIPVLQWLQRMKCLSLDDVCAAAARGGQLHVLQWALLRSRPFPWGATTTAGAAQGGHLALLQWLLDYECPWDASMCAAAARGNQLSVLRWLRMHGYPWDASTCAAAASGGHFALLQWAREHGCAWDASSSAAAAVGGHLALLWWLIANGCPFVLNEAFAAAVAGAGQLHVLQWARSVQPPCPWDAAVVDAAIEHDHREVVEWAVANGCPYSQRVYDYARRQRLGVHVPGMRRHFAMCRLRRLKVPAMCGAAVTAVALLARAALKARRAQQAQQA